MGISYRFTSGVALLSLAFPILDMALPPAPLRPRSMLPSGGAVGFDPCSMWAQLHPMYRLVALVWFGAYFVFLLRGLWNRSAPRWLAVAGALALFLWVESDWWRVSAGCVSNRSLVFLLVWAAMTDLLFLHHVIQRPTGTVAERRDFRGRISRINMAIARILVFMPIGWSALNAIRPFDREPTFAEKAIDLVQRCFSWTTLALFVATTALFLVMVVVRLRASMRAAGVNIP